jgi:Flagellar biosynthesis pathway, component FlhA
VSEVLTKKSGTWEASKMRPLLLPVAAISMVFVMLIPVPSFVLDLLLAASITASVIVFLTAVQVRRASTSPCFHAASAADDVPAVLEPRIQPKNSAARP